MSVAGIAGQLAGAARGAALLRDGHVDLAAGRYRTGEVVRDFAGMNLAADDAHGVAQRVLAIAADGDDVDTPLPVIDGPARQRRI